MNYTKQQIGAIKEIEKQVGGVFDRVKKGDREVFRQNHLYDIAFLEDFASHDFYAVRKYLKEKIGGINKEIEEAENDTLKDLMLQLTLFDQMKYDIKKLENKLLVREQ